MTLITYGCFFRSEYVQLPGKHARICQTTDDDGIILWLVHTAVWVKVVEKIITWCWCGENGKMFAHKCNIIGTK